MSSSGLSKGRLGRLHDVIAGFVERGEVPGLVALASRHGETHVEALGMKVIGGSDRVRRDTIFRIASMTKPITAAAAMILVEECKLRFDDPVDPLLPELADRRVLRRLDGPLDDTTDSRRPIGPISKPGRCSFTTLPRAAIGAGRRHFRRGVAGWYRPSTIISPSAA
jgi:CubicO group peptidase (beta-lactamase class C family)